MTSNVRISVPAEMADLDHVFAVADFDPPQVRPGVLITQVAYTLAFRFADGKYLITEIDGPILHAKPGPR